jgi:hypothetical protein
MKAVGAWDAEARAGRPAIPARPGENAAQEVSPRNGGRRLGQVRLGNSFKL